MNRGFLSGKTIALSISAPEDLAQCGMGPEHINDALGEISRQLLALGAHLLYGGDLREGGLTKMLFELAARYSPPMSRKEEYGPAMIDVVPYPMHAELTADELMAWEADFAGIAELRYMSQGGGVWSFATRPQHLVQLPNDEWSAELTAMRVYTTGVSDARIVLGGRTSGYLGAIPGVVEEALISASVAQPVFVVGGFGGAAHVLAQSLAANEPVRFGNIEHDIRHTENGLDEFELARLATSPHIDEITVLLTRGLAQLFAV